MKEEWGSGTKLCTGCVKDKNAQRTDYERQTAMDEMGGKDTYQGRKEMG